MKKEGERSFEKEKKKKIKILYEEKPSPCTPRNRKSNVCPVEIQGYLQHRNAFFVHMSKSKWSNHMSS